MRRVDLKIKTGIQSETETRSWKEGWLKTIVGLQPREHVQDYELHVSCNHSTKNLSNPSFRVVVVCKFFACP